MRVGYGERSSTAVSGWVQRLVSQSQFIAEVCSSEALLTRNAPSEYPIK
ncbi:hypothetical protein [Rubritalea tangerina]